MRLRDLQRGTPATVKGFDTADPELETRLREIGFAEGDRVESLHRGLFRGNPVAIRLNHTVIAMRQSEAAAVLVSAETEVVALADAAPLAAE